eukprot:CAMPEP_0171099714 /NCGR_PEP_ID=MMETSP0766_2-20121228/52363_1 /TAXON_ID=439317 /ORGANISM="Gambierdiscus australes, Strain CAWD 149" /LENGTH=148 /DNA_ID=CAMNT_0011559399 /DNA_START=46 /DNA_END=492 /DNA_ORIENTATION=+
MKGCCAFSAILSRPLESDVPDEGERHVPPPPLPSLLDLRSRDRAANARSNSGAHNAGGRSVGVALRSGALQLPVPRNSVTKDGANTKDSRAALGSPRSMTSSQPMRPRKTGSKESFDSARSVTYFSESNLRAGRPRPRPLCDSAVSDG